MSFYIGDKQSVLFEGLSGFWQRFFKDTKDLQAYYQASEIYLGQVYLDLLSTILNIGIKDTPVFNKEYWKLFTISETELNYVAGISPPEGRYYYDMPGEVVHVDFLQNTIFNPALILERGVEFEVESNDGYIRFKGDPFRMYQDSDTGEWLPLQNVAWRSLRVAVGNSLTDTTTQLYGREGISTAYDLGIYRGDTLRLLAQQGPEIHSGLLGVLTKVSEEIFKFFDVDVGDCRVGDILHVYGNDGAPGNDDDKYRQFYIVKAADPDGAPDEIELEPLSVVHKELTGSTNNLYWKMYHAVYFEVTPDDGFKDYEVDYIDGQKLIGASTNPYPLDLKGPFVYSIVRDAFDPDVYSVSVDDLLTQWSVVLGQRHIIPGSVTIFARRLSDNQPVKERDKNKYPDEDGDFSVDYLNGVIHRITDWVAPETSTVLCNYSYQTEVMLSAAGDITEQTVGQVKQLSFWVPEVKADRFTLWYNYGSLLNRFEASSETYKAFLKGIMYLYVSGPILQRIESALNVAAGYPVTGTNGEVLQAYDNGELDSGTNATIVGAGGTVTLAVGEYEFSDADLGRSIIFPHPLNDANKGRFIITSVNTITNTATLEYSYPLVDETPVDWIISPFYTKKVTTNRAVYEFPYFVPIREDIQDSLNWNVLTFDVFEPLTTAFIVTDYLEDPNWWHDITVPPALWPNDTQARRLVTTRLYEHIIGALDDSRIGDPGLFIGADESGMPSNPTDLSGNPVSIYRHSVAFVVVDRYLKSHMFYIEISADLELDAQFKDDLENLILIAKPSYTYPSVNLNDQFVDILYLWEIFSNSASFDPDEGTKKSTMFLADNFLKIGDPFPWAVGDFFKYNHALVTTSGGFLDPIPVGITFTVPGIPVGAGLIQLNLLCTRTIDGEPALEGRDYTVNWVAESSPGVPNPLAWQVKFLTECDNTGPLAPRISCDVWYAERTNGTYDTLLGWTPLTAGMTNPWYVRAGALNPDSFDYATEWDALRTESIDRTVQLTVVIDDGVNPPVGYTYP